MDFRPTEEELASKCGRLGNQACRPTSYREKAGTDMVSQSPTVYDTQPVPSLSVRTGPPAASAQQ